MGGGLYTTGHTSLDSLDDNVYDDTNGLGRIIVPRNGEINEGGIRITVYEGHERNIKSIRLRHRDGLVMGINHENGAG